MRRNYIFFIILILSSFACSLIKPTTPVSIPTNLPTQPVSTQVTPGTVTIAPSETQAPISRATGTTTPEEPTPTPYPTSVLNSQMKDEIDLIQSQVVQERELQPKNQVAFVLLSRANLRNNVISDYNTEYTDEDINDEVIELSIIGLLEPNFDLRTLDINLLSEDIAGYYDNQTKEMFVIEDQGFNGPEHLTYSHEYTHVLQDQNYDIQNGLKYNDDYCEGNSEYCAAVQALLEGDATVSEFNWYQSFATTTDQEQVIQFYDTLKTPIFDSAPAYRKDDEEFPYKQGQTFVQYFYDQSGWSAVAAVYKNPPVSTEQILHPELYPSDTPISVKLPEVASALGKGWRELSRDQMGEWYTYLILADGINPQARLDTTTADAAAAGWGGDQYLVLYNDGTKSTVFVMKDIWDTANDASQFTVALEKSLNSRFGLTATQQGDTYTWTYSGGYSSLLITGATTIWIIAPDAATAGIISGLIKP